MYVTKLNRLKDEDLKLLVEKAEALTMSGRCCPRECGINRSSHVPPCGAHGEKIRIASFHRHMGEEPPVSGTSGACNIFFSGCTMKCVFCQNFPFSQMNNGRLFSSDEFSEKIMQFQSGMVHNINLVTADQYLLQVLKCLQKLKGKLTVPVVYNCSGYHTPELLEIVDSFADIYLYDLKYYSDIPAVKYSGARGYGEISRAGIEYVLRRNSQWIEEKGLLKAGVIIRHLVLPGSSDESAAVVGYVGGLKNMYHSFRMSVMSQYFPAYRAYDFPELDRKLTLNEYDIVMDEIEKYSIEGWFQQLDGNGGC